ATAGRRFDAGFGHAVLHLFLHFLGLLHHRGDVHGIHGTTSAAPYSSSTFLISAGKTSSRSRIAGEAIASCFASVAPAAAGAGPLRPAAGAADAAGCAGWTRLPSAGWSPE